MIPITEVDPIDLLSSLIYDVNILIDILNKENNASTSLYNAELAKRTLMEIIEELDGL